MSSALSRSTLTAELPHGTIPWNIFSIREHHGFDGAARGADGVTVLWHDITLHSGAFRVPLVEPKTVEIYAVRTNGVTVHHRAVSEDDPVRFHKASSVFRPFGSGNVVRLRLFTNTENVACSWPGGHGNVPKVPGLVLVVTRGEDGEDGKPGPPARHVFFCSTNWDRLWNLNWEKSKPVRPVQPVRLMMARD
jgi:hypothetical protein